VKEVDGKEYYVIETLTSWKKGKECTSTNLTEVTTRSNRFSHSDGIVNVNTK